MADVMLLSGYGSGLLEAGCDEAGRGSLAGPVVAAAVILPADYTHKELRDSKKLTPAQRKRLRKVIQQEAISWAVAFVDNVQIDRMNILNASIAAIHTALDQLTVRPGLILVDGNQFHPYKEIPHVCIPGGDHLYLSIAAASILAKTYRDEYMTGLSRMFPEYQWDKNKGYPTAGHKQAIIRYGITIYHRKSFRLFDAPLLNFNL